MKYWIYANGDIVGNIGKGGGVEFSEEERKMFGMKEKKFTITNQDYRTIVSAAVNLANLKNFKLIFLTLTFPLDLEEKVANRIIKQFFKKGVRNYDFREYIWTKERQTLNHDRLHFHALVDFPFIPICNLQELYNSCISANCSDAVCGNNSLRLPPRGHDVDNMEALQVAKYIAKYCTKERGQYYSQPCFAISKGLYPVKLEIDNSDMEKIVRDRGIYKSYGNKYYEVI